MEKTPTTFTFDFGIGEVVYNKPGEDDQRVSLSSPSFVRYTVVSRIYEEIGVSGNGVVSYVVRHNDPTTPGGGKLYKFAQDELVNSGAYDTLMQIKRQTSKKDEYITSGPNYWPNALDTASAAQIATHYGTITTNSTSP